MLEPEYALYMDLEFHYFQYLYADRTTQIIQEHDPNEPLFMYLPIPNVHSPHQVPKKYEDMYSHISDTDRRTYLGMVTAMDDFAGA